MGCLSSEVRLVATGAWNQMIAFSISEIVVLYTVPLLALILIWLGTSMLLYALVRSPARFDFKEDLLRKFEAKRLLPSVLIV